MPTVASKVQDAPAAARPQDTTNTKSKSCSQRIRQRRAHRTGGRLACQGGSVLPPPNQESAADSVPNISPNGTHCAGIDITAAAWMKRLPTGMEAGESPSKAYKHCQVFAALDENSDGPMGLVDDVERCNEVLMKLEEGSPAEQHELLLWLHPAAQQLALSKTGCRVMQKALEVAGGADRDRILIELKPHIIELYSSPWGNHVLSRAIEVLPAAKNDFVILAFLGRGVIVSKHRYGCRVVCRLIEHCPEKQIGELLDEVLMQVDHLARHTYGNFVVQSVIEHASPARRSAVLTQVLSNFTNLAMHRTGSLVAQRALDYCDANGQKLVIQALLQEEEGKSLLVEVACSHYGSYVVEQLAGLRCDGLVQEIAQILGSNLTQLKASDHAQRVLVAFGLATIESLSHA